MAKYLLKMKTRPLYLSRETYIPGELYDLNMHCQFEDDAEQLNDFDITLTCDSVKSQTTVAYDTSEEFISNLKGTAIAGTRTSDTVFTRSSGSWTVDGLIGYWLFSYVDGGEGVWSRVTDNDGTTVTVDSSINNLYAACDRVALVPRLQLRNNLRLIPPAGMLGTFFQIEIEKQVPTTGLFKYRNTKINVIPRPELGQEFLAGMDSSTHGWEG